MREDGDHALARGVIEPGSSTSCGPKPLQPAMREPSLSREHFLKTHLFTIDFHLNGLYQIAT